MHAVVMFTIIAVTTFDYLASIGVIHRLFRFVPELISLVVAIYVLVAGVQTRFAYVRPVYWLVFGGLFIVMICGLVINMVPTGATIAGMRSYLRAIPFFFLPAVYAFTSQQVRAQLTLILFICFLQAPIALQQRWATAARGGFTGDDTTGTIVDSGMLSVFLIASACLLTAAYLRQRIKASLYLPLLLVILFPTMINETKATLVFLPVGLLAVFLAGSGRAQLGTNFVKACIVFFIFVPPFIFVYDYYQPEHRPSIGEFFSNPETIERYKSKGIEIGDRHVSRQAPRGDSVAAALSFATEDPVRAAFGVGAGNARDSALGPNFNGRYYQLLSIFMYMLFNIVLVELGLIGLGLVLIVKWCVFQDCVAVAGKDKDIHGVLALGWVGIVPLAVLGMVYANFSWSSALSYLFWYFSGVIAAQRLRA